MKKNNYIILLITIFILSLVLSVTLSITIKEGITNIPKLTGVNYITDVPLKGSNVPLLHYTDNYTDNYDLLYHNVNDFNSLPNDLILDINNPVIYYKPNTFKYGSQFYVPSYEDTVYLSRY
jgi:hypothetical protein